MPSFTEVFGGSVIYPSDTTYLSLAIAANTTLLWPLEQQVGGDDIVADIIDVTASSGGLSITLSDARQVSTGFTSLFYNAGANTFTVLDADGGTIVTVASGTAWQIYLRDNSTEAGLWRTFQYGAGTSSANAAALAGAGLKAITTTLNTKVAVSTQSSNYVILDADRAKAIVWTGGTGTFTLPNPATVGADWYVIVRNLGTGSVTVTPSAGTIDEGASKIFSLQDASFIISDGTNYFTVGFGQSVNSVFDFISVNVAGTGDFTLSGANLNRVSYQFTGILTGTRNIVVPALIQQYWVDNSTTGAFDLYVKTATQSPGVLVPQGRRTILYCDGTDVVHAETLIVSTPVLVADGGTGLSSVAQGDLLYGSAVDTYSLLNKNTTATRYLGNTGASNNPAWAQVDLTNGVTGALPATNGGTGQISYAIGDLLYASTTTALSKLADVAAGSYLRSGGVTTAPLWSTATLPNSAVTGDLLYASASNTYANLSDVAAGSFLRSGGVSTAPAWSTTTWPNGATQGDVLYASASNTITTLAKNASATRYLSNTGASNDPAWAQVNLADGVTGNLPVANLNSGTNASATTFWRGDGTWATPGGSGTTNIQISGNSLGVNAFTLAGSPGGVVTVTFEVGTGVILYAPDEATPALDFRGFASGSTINFTNLGYVLGAGGRGGDGAGVTGDDLGLSRGPAQAGGNAIEGPGTGITFNITNAAGFIWGGGGGGGGGGASSSNGVDRFGMGGGGGGGAGGGYGGAGNRLTNDANEVADNFATDGANGSTGPSGTFGAAGVGTERGSANGADGGAGGDWGAAGATGGTAGASTYNMDPGAGGAAGKAINLNGGSASFVSGSGSPNVEGAVS